MNSTTNIDFVARLESVVSLADTSMYAAKSRVYAATGHNRRGRTGEGG